MRATQKAGGRAGLSALARVRFDRSRRRFARRRYGPGCGLSIGLLAKHRPRHDLQQHTGRVERVVSGAHRFLELLECQTRRLARRVGRDIGGHEGRRRKRAPARQVLWGIDKLGLAQERIMPRQVGGMRMAIVASGRVDDVAAQSDQRSVLPLEVERHRRDRVTLLDLRFVALFIVRPGRCGI